MSLSAATERPAASERDENLWFDNGSIIIKAQSKLFNLSRGILTLQSPIFADMFRIPQPPDIETIDGSPVVEIPDSVDDATVFFRAIFDSSFFEAYPAPTTFETLAGILRLSTKYEVDYLRRRALIHLSSAYPTKLSVWDSLKENFTEQPSWGRPSWSILANSEIRFDAIRLSRQIDAPWVLPAAFYQLAADREVDHPADLLHDEYLSPTDQLSFLKGYALQRSATASILRFLFTPRIIDGCRNRTKCAEKKLVALEFAHHDWDEYPAIPLQIWAEEDWTWLEDVCPSCRSGLREAHQEARKDFWERLPGMYGLVCWKELEELKVAAIGVV
ncbi:hypothetical protein B0H11DRAFT_1884190 [Mycena galericulata]|nr:hypothetical protein B0H11DRAFT_1884190 [Mycena galericulata]